MHSCARYYAGKTLFITGATGFLGKALVEAILDRLPDVGRIYLLIRPRKDDDGNLCPPEHTLQTEILGSSAFDRLRSRDGDAFETLANERLRAVAGDLSQERLGLNEADWRRLSNEVDVVINSGAMAVFDAPLDLALQINTLGPLRVLEFVQAAARRPFLAHISTCYVNNHAGPVFETPLDPCRTPRPGIPFDVDRELADGLKRVEAIRAAGGDAQAIQERMVAEGLERARRYGWNDTYTFTKAMGEQLLRRHRGDAPAIIVRPSIIESAMRHPAPGWIEGFRMMDPLIVGFGRGKLPDFPANPETVLDVVPADVVVNALLTVIPRAQAGGGPEVMQVATGMDSPLVIKHFYANLVDYFNRHPLRSKGSAKGKGTGNGTRLPELTFPDVASFLRRLDRRYRIPLRIANTLLQPLALTAWGRARLKRWEQRPGQIDTLRHLAAIYGPYAQGQYRFLTYHMKALWDSLDEDERRDFPMTVNGLDWKRYLQEVHLPGIERYLLRMARANPRPLSPEEAAVNAPVVERSTAQWHKAERILSATRDPAYGDLSAWTTPVYKKALQRSTCGTLRFISRHYLGLETAGLEELPARGPFIIASNHCSHVDTGLLLSALGPRASSVHPIAAGDYWFRGRAMGWLLHSTLGGIPFDRSGRNVAKALALPAEVLRQGHSLIFYPEGTRSPDGSMRSFKSTVGLLALAAGAPLVPAHVSGSFDVLPKGKTLLRRHPVRVTFGPPIHIEPYLRRLEYDHVARVARAMAADLEAEVRRLADDAAASGLRQAS